MEFAVTASPLIHLEITSLTVAICQLSKVIKKCNLGGCDSVCTGEEEDKSGYEQKQPLECRLLQTKARDCKKMRPRLPLYYKV